MNAPEPLPQPEPERPVAGASAQEPAAALPAGAAKIEGAKVEGAKAEGGAAAPSPAESLRESGLPRPPVLVRDVPPPKLPGYQIDGIVGRGSTGVVYRAVQLAVEREVALKVLHPDLGRNPRLVRRLQREARTMAKLAHPHVVSAIDMGQSDGQWWYAMELVDGPSLADRLRLENRLSEREALRLFLPLAEALEHLWDHGVVHRDIKPANVLIDRTRGAQLADLGLAFHEDDPGLTRQGGTLGTPHYISPEQARDPHAVDVRSDIWSFGATLFHALCGRPPFAGESLAEVLSSVLHARIPDPKSLAPDLSGGMALVVRKCLVRDEAKRYQTPRDLRQDLERLRERRSPTVRRSTLDPVARPGAHWRRAGAIGLASGAALVLLIFGIEWKRAADESQAIIAPPAEVVYAPLEQLLTTARANPARLAGTLSNLERMRDAVPLEASGRWWSVRNELWDTLRQRVAGVRGESATQLDRHLERGDFVAARAALGTELESRLRAESGYALADVPAEVGDPLRRWRDERRAALEQAIRRAVDGVASAVALHYQEVVLHDLDALLTRQRWRTARALLNYDRERLLEGAGLDGAGLPAEDIDDALGSVRADVAARRRLLDEAWIAADRSLRDWVRARGAALEAEVRAGRRPRPVETLEADFDVEMARRGMVVEEVPDPNLSAALAELEKTSRLLAQARVESLELELRGAYDLRARHLAPSLVRRRDYDRAIALWSGLAARLAAIADETGGARWHADLERAVARRLEEAERLRGVLARAAEGVREKRGQQTELLIGNIRYRGAIDVGDDPLADGFRLRTGPTRVHPLELRAPLDGGQARQVALADLEALAGLLDPTAPDSSIADLTPDARLDLALLRRSEGELVAASRALGAGPWPEDEQSARLAQELSNDLFASLSPSQRGQESGPEPVALLERLDNGLADADPSAALALIELLLAEHGQQPAVGLRLEELRGRRDALRRRAAQDS